MRTRFRRRSGGQDTTLSSDDDGGDGGDEASLANLRFFMPAAAAAANGEETSSSGSGDDSIIPAYADDATVSLTGTVNDEEPRRAPRASKRIRVPPPAARAAPTPVSFAAAAPPVPRRLQPVLSAPAYHVVDPEQASRYEAAARGPPDTLAAFMEEYRPPRAGDALAKYAAWTRRVFDFRRRLDDDPWYRGVAQVAAYAGLPLEKLVYVPKLDPPRRATGPLEFGSFAVPPLLPTLAPPPPAAAAPAPPGVPPDVFLRLTEEIGTARELVGRYTAIQEQQAVDLKRLRKERSADVDRWKAAFDAGIAENEARVAEMQRQYDALVAKNKALADRLMLRATVVPESSAQRHTVISGVKYSKTYMDELDAIRAGWNDVIASLTLVPRLRAAAETARAARAATDAADAAAVAAADAVVAAADAALAAASTPMAVAAADAARRAKTQELTEREAGLSNLRRLEARIEADAAVPPAPAPETTGLILEHPGYAPNQGLALEMIRARFPQTLRHATVRAFEQSRTCARFFSLIVASHFSRGFFMVGQRSARASDYERYADAISYAMQQFRFAELDPRTGTVELRYDAIAEVREAAGARAGAACQTSLQYATTPYVGRGGASSVHYQQSQIAAAYGLRSSILEDVSEFGPLSDADARRSPYGGRGIGFGSARFGGGR